MNIKIIREPVTIAEVQKLAKEIYGDMVKGVADVEREVIALGGEYHIDANAKLIKAGSSQNDLWGFNIHVKRDGEDWIECTSLINIRPQEGNRGMLISDQSLVKRIRTIVEGLIIRI
jgi:hypothetical protein